MTKNKGSSIIGIIVLFLTLMVIFQTFTSNLLNVDKQIERIHKEAVDLSWIKMLFQSVEQAIINQCETLTSINDFNEVLIENQFPGFDLISTSDRDWTIEFQDGSTIYFEDYYISDSKSITDYTMASDKDMLLNGGINTNGDIYSNADVMHSTLNPFYEYGFTNTGSLSYRNINANRFLTCSNINCYDSHWDNPTTIIKSNFNNMNSTYNSEALFTFDLDKYTFDVLESITGVPIHSADNINTYLLDNRSSFDIVRTVAQFGGNHRLYRPGKTVYIGNTNSVVPTLDINRGIRNNDLTEWIVINGNAQVIDDDNTTLRGNFIIAGDFDVDTPDFRFYGNIIVMGDVHFNVTQKRRTSNRFTIASFDDVFLHNNGDYNNQTNSRRVFGYFYANGNIKVDLFHEDPSCSWFWCDNIYSELDLRGGLYAKGDDGNFTDITNVKGMKIDSLSNLLTIRRETNAGNINRSILSTSGSFYPLFEELNNRDA